MSIPTPETVLNPPAGEVEVKPAPPAARKKPIRVYTDRRVPNGYNLTFKFFGHPVYAWRMTNAEFKAMTQQAIGLKKQGDETVKEAAAAQKDFEDTWNAAQKRYQVACEASGAPEQLAIAKAEMEASQEAARIASEELLEKIAVTQEELLERSEQLEIDSIKGNIVAWELPDGEGGILPCDVSILTPGDRKELLQFLVNASRMGSEEAHAFLARSGR